MLERAPLVPVWMATSGLAPLATAQVRPRNERSRSRVGRGSVQMPRVCTDPCPENTVKLALSHPSATFLTVISYLTAVLLSPCFNPLEAGYPIWLLLKLSLILSLCVPPTSPWSSHHNSDSRSPSSLWHPGSWGPTILILPGAHELCRGSRAQ